MYISIISGPLSATVLFELQKLQIIRGAFGDRSTQKKHPPIGVEELVDEKVGETKTITSTTLQLERSDEGRALLGSRIDSALEWMRVAERGISVKRVMKNQRTAGLSRTERVTATGRKGPTSGENRRPAGRSKETYLIVPSE